eukprot:CAMPEP_0179377936 /NCGR_PEP_ID=MMETSP0797-20121207/89079_1 /TAXON_ID=47934 /ORGANISM="Dinophysis acuminata, Strain DAEP01" /LENGTH=378 /DNA_ID=CAMNT_0021093997 /DNA_START=6 /DNA_END=1140 /DNA_ORIENTATION=-
MDAGGRSPTTRGRARLPLACARGAVLLLRVACAAADECAARDHVFFGEGAFPGTPGRFANERSTPPALSAAVAAWETRYEPIGSLTPAQHRQYFEDGFVIVPDLLPRAALDAAVREVEGLVDSDSLAEKLLAAGKITDLHEDAGFHERLTLIEEGVSARQRAAAQERRAADRHTGPLGAPCPDGRGDAAAGERRRHRGAPGVEPALQDAGTAEWGAGDGAVDQDNAYLDEESWATHQVTAWVPLVDANATNGCMQVVRGAHRSGGTLTHACCVGGTWYTETTPKEIEATLGADMRRDVVTCEVPFGSVLLLNNLVPHRSLPNYSGGIRWSLDLRWQRADEPNGFHGLKPSLLMKRAHEAFNGSVQWGAWASQDRTASQ